MEYNGYNIVTHDRYACYVIKTIGSGSLKKSLEGNFRSFKDAQQAIDTLPEPSKKINRGTTNATKPSPPRVK